MHVFSGLQLSDDWFGQVMGRMVKHTELAEKWLDKVQRASHTTPTYEFLEVLLQDAEQFMWAGHEMDSVGSSCHVRVRLSARRMCHAVGHERRAVGPLRQVSVWLFRGRVRWWQPDCGYR
jgi:hypothetical protein